ncbi:shikimate kinase [Pelotomaculum propionicicum]|uniref:Shikimate kinase n=1 Tax=Pelotomaculum propionicicum TaxID=258475 RepID=A0A4Y7RLB1_9FIRM|nr:shikimate kinase [Pelotomaculum propionicicum]NLI11372.1 shikimate kinase [Peptococcaceae bacterium]TEB09591.1 Shikimate kinase [Pelotomaculum propionicicum]
MKNIVLIGFMGTGKTSVGRRLAQRLGRDFVDTDAEIEAVTGKTITQIFARDGVVRFRSEENLLVKKLAVRENLVISTGGGLVLNPNNVRLLKENGVLIALTASPEVLYARLANKKTRPLVLKGDLKQRIAQLLAEREGAYDVADFFVDTGVSSVDGVVEQILRYLSGREDMQ